MKTTNIQIVFLSLLCLLGSTSCHKSNKNRFRENGWYHVANNEKDSLSIEPIVTIKDFVDLRLDSDVNGVYAIVGQISKHKQNKWTIETEKAIGKQIAFVFNNSIITAPQVNMKIDNGVFQISSKKGPEIKLLYNKIRKEKSDSLVVLFKGWDKDSLYLSLSSEQKDSMNMTIDYWEAKAWVDLISNPDKHYWYNIEDSTEYKKLENALDKELQQFGVSSHSSNYMKSVTYNKYKQYIFNNPEYINLMFRGPLFQNVKGLNSYLIDDIIQSRYPEAPSIKLYVHKTTNTDDEKFAIHEWQKTIWYLMNNE